MSQKIFPRNLPAARFARQVEGNPITTRIESAVGNCYPGLETDHRNLDRRFFPGLVFNFVDTDAAELTPITTLRAGAHLINGADLDNLSADPALSLDASNPYASLAKTLRAKLRSASSKLREGEWFISRVKQGNAEVRLYSEGANGSRVNFNGTVVWRLVRSLFPKPCEIWLERRRQHSNEPKMARGGTKARDLIHLTGWRRDFIDRGTGLIDLVYVPGELSQSLCSPWQHDFRDCACDYWASNHPDIVLAGEVLGTPTLPTGVAAQPVAAERYVDWLRRDRFESGLAQPPGTYSGVVPFQLDHYEINNVWQELAFVLHREEIQDIYREPHIEDVAPYASPDDLAEALVAAAGVEHALALEYLYARYSVKDVNEFPARDAQLRSVVEFVRHELLMIAVSEMRHLRWANQLLWDLRKSGLLSKPLMLPALGVASQIPMGQGKQRAAKLQSLTPDALDVYIAGEAPSGGIDGLYSRAVSTLRRHSYPDGMKELASQIVADGVGHYSRFSELKVLLTPYVSNTTQTTPPPYLWTIQVGSTANQNVKRALGAYRYILQKLHAAYVTGDAEEGRELADARAQMMKLDGIAEKLAQQGIGIPFF